MGGVAPQNRCCVAGHRPGKVATSDTSFAPYSEARIPEESGAFNNFREATERLDSCPYQTH